MKKDWKYTAATLTIIAFIVIPTVGITHSVSQESSRREAKQDSVQIAYEITSLEARLTELRSQQRELISSIKNLQETLLRVEGALITLESMKADLSVRDSVARGLKK